MLLDYTDAQGRRQKQSLGFPVRTGSGKRWAWDWTLLGHAREAAEDRAAALRLGQLRKEDAELRVTVGSAFEMYHDPDRGGVRGAKSTVHRHRFARREWEKWLGVNTPWNAVTVADVESLVRRFKERGHAPSAFELLKNLRACYNWLRKKKGLRQLMDPTESLTVKEVMAGHVPKRPRYSPDEARRIIAARDDVDPRFALMVALMDDSGARREALRLAMRSQFNEALEFDPGEDAPHGWLHLPALKGQDRPLVFLTGFQRREIDRALTGYLQHLEALYEASGTDYPLFPAARVRDTLTGAIRPFGYRDEKARWRPAQSNIYRPVSPARTREWLIEAEKKAGVPHVLGRGWHGIRRAVSDYLEEATDLATLTTALGWSSQSVPEAIYLEKRKSQKRGRAREAMEKKRRDE